MITSYLSGELPELHPGVPTENSTQERIIVTGFRASSLLATLPKEQIDVSKDSYYGITYSAPFAIDLPEISTTPIQANISVTESRRFVHGIDNRSGIIVTDRVLFPRANPAIIAVGASVETEEEVTVSALSSTRHRGYENIPGLDKLRNNVSNQVSVEFHRILFINSVLKAIKNSNPNPAS